MKFLAYFLAFASLFGLISCGQGKPVDFQTDKKEFSFQLSSDFSKNERFASLNFFENGNYRIEFDIYPKPNEVIQRIHTDIQRDNRPYRSSFFRDFSDFAEVPTENENGYPIMAFYGYGKDPSALLPTHYEGFVYLVESPNFFATITLKHTARRRHALDKTEAINYIKPLLKTLKQNENLIYSPEIERFKVN